MERWREIYRAGFLPLLSKEVLQVLLKGLEDNDPALIQGATADPRTDSLAVITGACDLVYGAWKLGKLTRGELALVGDAEEEFSRIVYESDDVLGAVGRAGHYLNWYDEIPRDEMRRELIAEVKNALATM